MGFAAPRELRESYPLKRIATAEAGLVTGAALAMDGGSSAGR